MSRYLCARLPGARMLGARLLGARKLGARLVGLGTVLMLIGVLAGCATIPESTSPKVIVGFGDNPDAGPASITPRAGGNEEDIIRGFLQANADATGNYNASRQFLTDAGAAEWVPETQASIVEDISVVPVASTDGDHHYVIRANKLGTFDGNGVMTPGEESVEQQIAVRQQNGQWRITSFTPSLLIDSAQFDAVYQRHLLYFPSVDGRALVPDARWVAPGSDSLAQVILELLAAGPRPELMRAVSNPFGVSAVVRGAVTKADGSRIEPNSGYGGVEVTFDGVAAADRDARRLLAAQVVWTLDGAGIAGPYKIKLGDAALDTRFENGWDLSSAGIPELDPSNPTDLEVGLHAVSEGRLIEVDGPEGTPVAGPLGDGTTVVHSAAISRTGLRTAAVTSAPRAEGDTRAQRVALVLGSYGGQVTEVATGQNISRPTFEPDETAVWAAVDDTRVVRAAINPSSGLVSTSDVDVSAVTALVRGAVADVRLSPDGARVALAIGGRVVIGIVEPGPSGNPTVTNPMLFSGDRNIGALSVDFLGGDRIIVGRSAAESPVLNVEYDSGRVTPLPSRNLTPPISSIASGRVRSGNAAVELTPRIYAADSSGVWQLAQLSGSGGSAIEVWNLVPALSHPETTVVLPG